MSPARVHHARPVLHARISGQPVKAYTHAELSRRARWDAGWILTYAPETTTAAMRSFLVSIIRSRGPQHFDVLERVGIMKARAQVFLEHLQRDAGAWPDGSGQSSHGSR